MSEALASTLKHLEALVGFDTRNPPRAIGTGGMFDYLQAHLDDRNTGDDGDDAMVRFVDQKFQIGHAIALFDFTVKKLRERS